MKNLFEKECYSLVVASRDPRLTQNTFAEFVHSKNMIRANYNHLFNNILINRKEKETTRN